ncbi:MAG: hypothetical protein HYZ84_05770 [Candidatus Omnitrophica bacterium]|nr:hypothetical protein [Candidatus Omnitrophota bacterium]
MAKILHELVAGFTALSFILNMTLVPVYAAVTPTEQEILAHTPTQSAAAFQQAAPVVSTSQELESTQAFLQEDLKLEPVKSPTPEVQADESAESETSENSAEQNSSPYNFEQVIKALENAKDFTVAVVGQISKSDILKLAGYGYEIGLAIVDGIAVVFTSHEENQIRVPKLLKNLLDGLRTSFLVHFQPNQARPSLVDQQGATERGDRVEYSANLSVESGELDVYAYNGKVIEPTPYNVDHLISEIQKVSDANPNGQKLDAIQEYINELKENGELVLYRSEPPTVFPGFPVLGSFASSSINNQPDAVISIDQTSSAQFALNYDLSNAGSFGGAIINFGASAAGPQNLSGFSKFTFELRTNSTCSNPTFGCLKIEFVDTANRLATVRINGLTSTFQQYDIQKSDLLANQPNLDFARIKQINFVVENNKVNPKVGFMEVKTGGLDYNPFINPDATNPAITKLPATNLGERPVLTPFASLTNPDNSKDFSNVTVNMLSPTTAEINLNLYNTTSYGGTFLNYDDLGTAGVTETVNFNTLFPNGVVLGLDNGGTGLAQIKFEVTDITGKRDFVFLTGIDATARRWKVNLSQLDTVDLTKIQALALVVEGRHNGEKLNVNWGDFDFTPGVNPDATNPAITKVPATSTGERPTLTGFASQDFSNVTVTGNSPSTGTINFNLYNTSSFGGTFLSYDDFNTAGTIETINLNTVFPNGIVLGLDGAGINEVMLEVTDNTGKRDEVKLVGIDGTARRWKVLASQFDQVDVTKIQTISFVVIGRHVGHTLNYNWGDFDFTPGVNPDATNPAITKVPVTSTGERPVLTGFASQTNPDNSTDFSNVNVNLTSAGTGTINFNLYNTTSFGGTFLSYDNLATGGTIETIDLNTVFPNGIVLGLDGAGINEVMLEVTDNTGKRDEVKLVGIDGTARRWKVLASQFDQVDVTKIQTISLVVIGRHIGHTLNFNWGDFEFTPSTGPDATNPAITKVPAISTGERPTLTGFASPDFSNITVTQNSPTSATLNLNLYNTFSFGGAFLNYDDFTTGGTVENINLNTAFPNGIVLGLDNGGTGLTEVILEVTDNTGKRDKVKLTGIDGTARRWKVLASQFDQVDVTKIQTISLVIEGRHVGHLLNVNWGDFDFTPGVNPDGTNPAVTKVPVTSTGERPTLTGFASQDFSNVTVTGNSPSTGTINFNLYNTTSFGGTFLSYDNFTTGATIETINLNNVFPNGIVLGLSGAGITEVMLEVTDNTGKRDEVKLTGIDGTARRWKVLASQFDEVDVTKIQTISLVVIGRHVGHTLTYDWGDFDFTPGVGPDATNPAITKVPATSLGERPAITAFSSPDFSNVTVTQNSPTAALLTMNLYNTTSFGGVFINYDDFSTGGTVENINLNTAFPNGIVLGLNNGGTALTEVMLEVTDSTGKRDEVKLTGIDGTARRWKVLASQFEEVDVTKIQTISLVIVGRHVGDQLNVDWGDFDFTPGVGPDATNPAITKVPVTSTGDRPILTSFASQDSSTSSVTQTSASQATLNLSLANTTSFGGAFLAYDNFSTPSVETIDLNTVFPNGIVLGLDNGGTGITEVLLEMTDNLGKRDEVKLTGIDATARRWKVLASQFDQIDVTKISVISLVVVGQHINQKVNVNWGDFDFTPGVGPDATNPAITKVPATSTGDRPVLNSFVSQDSSSINLFVSSPTTATANFILKNNSSFGGAFFSYDNFNTSGTVETIDLNTVFPNGIVLGLDNNGTGITAAILEITDNTGKRDKVKLTGIDGTARRWKILTSQFDQADVTKIQTISLVVLAEDVPLVIGEHRGDLNINWGDFEFAPLVDPDATNPAITKVPATSLGERPVFTGFVSQDSSTVNVTQFSTTSAQVDLNLANPTSFGGAFINYDNFATSGAVETINLNTAFPSGIVLELTYSTSGIIIFEVTDNTGKRDRVRLNGASPATKRWKILTSLFDQVDVTKIQTMTLLIEGKQPNINFTVNWGDFDFTPTVNSDATNPAITKVPARSTGELPAFTGFASQDSSSVNVTQTSASQATLNLSLANTTSFGGAFIDYDNFNTAGTIESINLNTAFPNGIVLELDHGATGLTEVLLEVTDSTGKRDEVRLAGITGTAKRWKVLASQFDQVDVTKISVMTLVVVGQHINQKLNVNWGDFDFTPSTGPDATNPAITKVPTNSFGNKPAFTGFASQDSSSVNVTQASASQATLNLTLAKTTSFGGAFLSYDDFSTTPVETINLTTAFPNGIVLGLDHGGTGVTEVIFEVTDNTGKRDKVKLTGIDATARRWKILLSQFDQVDLTKIQTIVFVIEGQHLNQKLNVDWGDFEFTPAISPDATNPAITKVPVTSTNERPNFTGFADSGSNVVVTQTSASQATLNLTLSTTASFGGAFLTYDNFSTTPIETINFNTVFPNGIVLELDNGNTGLTELKLELTDNTGKRDIVKLVGIDGTARRWKILASQFDQIDVTKIQTIALVIEGQHLNQKVNVNWGDFVFTPNIAPDATNPATTPIPALNSSGVINLDTAFPNGIVLGLNASSGINQVKLEVTDVNGIRDFVILTGVDGTSRRWKVLTNQFDAADRTQIETIAIVVEGRHVSSTLNIDWGNFSAANSAPTTPSVPSDNTNPALTDVPVTSTGDRPALTGFASQPSPSSSGLQPVINAFASPDFSGAQANLTSPSTVTVDLDLFNTTSFGGIFIDYGKINIAPGDTVVVNQSTPSQAQLNFNLASVESFGGVFISYDNFLTTDNNAATTTDIETININTAFPNGIVFALDNAGTGITQAKFELTDITGKRDSVLLTDITNTAKRWKITSNLFDAIDLTKIQTIALVVEGQHANHQLNLNWGNFVFVPAISSDATNPAITKVPANSQGAAPELVGFVSLKNPDGSKDFSSMSVEQTSASQVKLTYNLKNSTSFGGVFFTYDNPATDDNNPATTTDIETINLNTVFPNGIVLDLNNAGTPITEIFLEVTDITGKRDRVRLIDIASAAKRWKVPVSQFDEVDVTKIQTIALVLTGVHDGNQILNINWGDWAFTPVITI